MNTTNLWVEGGVIPAFDVNHFPPIQHVWQAHATIAAEEIKGNDVCVGVSEWLSELIRSLQTN